MPDHIQEEEAAPLKGSGGTTAAPVHEMRAFNRFYTNLIGALDYSRHLYVPYTLTEARVLYELAHATGTDAADLRSELSLDAGYLSRLLAKFEENGLVERGQSLRDPRRQRIALTSRGRNTAELLDERSRDSVGALVDRVPPADRSRLTEAMHAITTILSRRGAPSREDVVLRAPAPGDLGWIISRNGSLYAAEYGWNSEYETLVAGIITDFARQHDPRRERVWVAELEGHPVGSVMCVRDHPSDDGRPQDDDTSSPPSYESPPTTACETPARARLRLLLVEPDARGLGIGDLLVSTCIGFARDAGYTDLVLWTNDVLTAARTIYERHGFTLTRQTHHHSFGVDLLGQDWHLSLTTPPITTTRTKEGA